MKRCLDCRAVFDEARFIDDCPHDQTVTGTAYCKTHDRFDCPCPGSREQKGSPRDREQQRPPKDRAMTQTRSDR